MGLHLGVCMLQIAELRFKLPRHTYFTDTVIPAKCCSTMLPLKSN